MSTMEEARRILTALEFDTKRTNEMAGRTLMALAGVDENTPWSEATGGTPRGPSHHGLDA